MSEGSSCRGGAIPNRYQLTETDSEGYRRRTKRNVEESDATLILNLGSLDGGSLETQRIAERLGKPVKVVQLDSALENGDERLTSMMAWLRDHRISSLNVAGPRESKRPGVYRLAREFLQQLVLVHR